MRDEPLPLGRVQRLTVLALLCGAAPIASGQDTALVGRWHATNRYGPDLRGELLVYRAGAEWRASIGARDVGAHIQGDSVALRFPRGGDWFGRFSPNRKSLVGHWHQPRTNLTGRRFATPVVLTACGAGCYRGRVEPLDDDFTFYMDVTPRADGKLGAFLRNPERNQGRFIPLDNVVRRGDTVLLRNVRDSALAAGVLGDGTLRVVLRGASFDFRREPTDSFSDYYPRGRPDARYVYRPPRKGGDGWIVGTLEEARLSPAKVQDMMEAVINASDSMHAHRLHALLIARDGKLVLEEYFHGEYADKPHDTRSASKTLATVVFGAAMQAGIKVRSETPVYATLGQSSQDLEPRKRALTVHHLLSMASGVDCDENSPEYHAGNEDNIVDQDTNPDWRSLALGLRTLRDPGVQWAYCGINPYLTGEILATVTKRPFTELMWDLVGEPLQMGPYYLFLGPVGDTWLGGGARFLPRDFMKLAQLYANGGTWNGRRILSQSWIDESLKPRYKVSRGTLDYGYLWWSREYDYRGRKVRAYFASGNGGQYSLLMPDLGLVMGVHAGNYADRANWKTITEFIPRYVLPAVLP